MDVLILGGHNSGIFTVCPAQTLIITQVCSTWCNYHWNFTVHHNLFTPILGSMAESMLVKQVYCIQP